METNIDGIKTYYEISGSGPYVLMIPGWAARCRLYQPVADALSSSFSVILLDLPGFTGGTDEPPEAWDVEGFVTFVIHFIEKLGIRELSLAGHSYGGRVIIHMMNRSSLPFTVKKIVLIDAAGIKPVRTASQKRKQAVFRFMKHFIPKDKLDDYKKKHGSADYRNASPLMRQCLVKSINDDLTDLLPSVSPETLLIWGTADTATPIGDGEKMEKLMPDAGLVRLENAGHFSFLDQPVIFERVMKSFFGI
mgnify:CR=1 FL=1